MTKDDSSPEVKKGEIKGILLESFQRHLLDFKFDTYKGSQYHFQRTRQHKNFKVWETLHVLFLLKDKTFSCSISSRINKSHVYSKGYNIGLINPHVDLITLKKATGAINIEDAYYFHNGKVQTTTGIVEQICSDFVFYGVPFLDKQYQRISNHAIINKGLDFIKALHIDRDKLKAEIDNQLKLGGHLTSNLTHPIYLELKETLQTVPNQSREDRQKIPGLAWELLELLWTEP